MGGAAKLAVQASEVFQTIILAAEKAEIGVLAVI